MFIGRATNPYLLISLKKVQLLTYCILLGQNWSYLFPSTFHCGQDVTQDQFFSEGFGFRVLFLRDYLSNPG